MVLVTTIIITLSVLEALFKEQVKICKEYEDMLTVQCDGGIQDIFSS